jgi:hypothetical protein
MPEEYKYDALFDPVKLRISYIWKSLYKIIEKKYNDFIQKNPDYMNQKTIPFLKIQFCRRERLQWEEPELLVPSIKKHETQVVKTVKETEKSIRDKRKLKTRMKQITSIKNNNIDDDDEAVKKMMDDLMNFDTKIRTYDVIEKQIFFEEVEDISLPIDVVFLEVEEDYDCNFLYEYTKLLHEQHWVKSENGDKKGKTSNLKSEKKIKTILDIQIVRNDVICSLNDESKFDGIKHHMDDDKSYNLTIRKFYDNICEIFKARRK